MAPYVVQSFVLLFKIAAHQCVSVSLEILPLNSALRLSLCEELFTHYCMCNPDTMYVDVNADT